MSAAGEEFSLQSCGLPPDDLEGARDLITGAGFVAAVARVDGTTSRND
jgi:hypothetical protein